MSTYRPIKSSQTEQTYFALYRDEIERHRQEVSAAIGVEVSLEWAAAEYLSQHLPAWRESHWTKLIRQELHENILRLLDRCPEPRTNHWP